MTGTRYTEKVSMTPGLNFTVRRYESYENLISSEMINAVNLLYESKRVLAPSRMMGISAGSKYPDACWKFIKIMMSDEVQQKCIEINSIPVSAVAFESLINKAMYPELRTAEENTALDLTSKTAVSEESIRRFREAVDSLNCIYYYDRDLANIINEESVPCLSGDNSPGEMAANLTAV
jgi:ABC-type glycerol-3-phosphate transport system substrate-binding protein